MGGGGTGNAEGDLIEAGNTVFGDVFELLGLTRDGIGLGGRDVHPSNSWRIP